MIFTKMQGCGNDYIYFDCMNDSTGEMQSKIIPAIERLSDRHFGVGGDGVVLICASKIADAKMRMFNADGSEGKMCGNASRCIAKYLFDNGYVKKDTLTLETLSGVKQIKLHIVGAVAVGATVNMGTTDTSPATIPVDITKLRSLGKVDGAVVSGELEVDGKIYGITTVGVGNPHCVVFTDVPVKDIDLEKVGRAFENHVAFPEGVNLEMVNVIGDNALAMRVWERGSGETLACGTGSTAAATAAVLNGLCDKAQPITVRLTGGKLTIRLKEDGAYMSGPAEAVFSGTINI